MTFAIIVLVALAGVMAFIRLSPSDPAQWHVALAPRPAALATPSPDKISPVPNGAYTDLIAAPDQTQAMLAALDSAALATPRTVRIAGSAETGRITWQTRSLFWGFPDYTTAEATPDGITLYGRQRFGKGDFGVNAARISGWIAALGPR
ncbi:hypothetical protein GCM10010873_25940 [Cypionkella aquatica]|uniref:DUF1499 domain-containing protein n=1 Tax=Cypionkella aquatica TaxID=1756042 RepID=A0AA37X2J3_9RHOB|nr:DUF1499 domain-containing protein [Cypionkella aquatica]GLS87620.1 hypothetical protein GCM10010873_25940 [Cypionkella aquatica]